MEVECFYLKKQISNPNGFQDNTRLILRIISKLEKGGHEEYEKLPTGQKIFWKDLMSHKKDLDLYPRIEGWTHWKIFMADDENCNYYNDIKESMGDKCPPMEELLDIYGKILTNTFQSDTGMGIFLSASKLGLDQVKKPSLNKNQSKDRLEIKEEI